MPTITLENTPDQKVFNVTLTGPRGPQGDAGEDSFAASTAGVEYVSPAVKTNFTKQQNFLETTLTDASNISWNLDNAQAAKVTLGGNRTLDNPTNMVSGGTYVLRVTQDVTGSRTLSYGTAYKWPAGTAPTLTATSNAVDILFFVSDGTYMYGAATLNFS